MNIQSLLNTCFITLIHGLSCHPPHGGSSNESAIFTLYLFHNPGVVLISQQFLLYTCFRA